MDLKEELFKYLGKQIPDLSEPVKKGIEEIITAYQPPFFSKKIIKPKIVVITPEITYLPENMGNFANFINTHDGGGLRDINGALTSELERLGVNVDVILPNYKKIYQDDITEDLYQKRIRHIRDINRIHLIEDDNFEDTWHVYKAIDKHFRKKTNIRKATALAKGTSPILNKLKSENDIVLIHCNDWMTGLIPAIAQHIGCKSLMSFHNIHTEKETMQKIKEQGLNIDKFREFLFFEEYPDFSAELNYSHNRVDYLTSGLLSADFINTVSPTFLKEITEGRLSEYDIIPEQIRTVICQRNNEGKAKGILNSPMITSNPKIDPEISHRYDIDTVIEGKENNKLYFQRQLGLEVDLGAPILFWPSRIDHIQKGAVLLLDQIPYLMDYFKDDNLQIAIVANGVKHYENSFKGFSVKYPGKISYKAFEYGLSQTGKAASDFILMPSLYEPCGIPQVEGPFYGTLPIVHKTGGIADTIEAMNDDYTSGNGFVFEHHLGDALFKTIEKAIIFHRKEVTFKEKVLQRVMKEANEGYGIKECAEQYINLYEDILGQPIR